MTGQSAEKDVTGERCTHWSTRPGWYPIQCHREGGHEGWHQVGMESWNDADGQYRAVCPECGHSLPHNERWGCLVEMGNSGSGSVADAVFCKCVFPPETTAP